MSYVITELSALGMFSLFMNSELSAPGSTLLAEFKARWQELLNFEGEISAWSTVYYTGLFLTIAWVLGKKRQNANDLIKNHDGLHPFLVLSIPLLNAVYILAIAVKG